jgi:hypothetical protein
VLIRSRDFEVGAARGPQAVAGADGAGPREPAESAVTP